MKPQHPQKIAFIGNDQGGAVYINSALPSLSALYNIMTIASGPAFKLWSKLNIPSVCLNEFDTKELEVTLSTFSPNLVVTGTSHYCELERISWGIANKLRVPSLAIIDSWTNLEERFIRLTDQTMVFPSAISIIDSTLIETIKKLLGVNFRIHITGHPHLEGVVKQKKIKKISNPDSGVKIVSFFSNPIPNKYADSKSYRDQFDVVEALLSACISFPFPIELVIKPHPREEKKRWSFWLDLHKRKLENIQISLSDDLSEKIIEKSDVVCGITSMALVEAVLMNRVAYSIQLNREVQINPILDLFTDLVVSTNEYRVAQDFTKVLADQKVPKLPQKFASKFDNSMSRLIIALEKELSLR